MQHAYSYAIGIFDWSCLEKSNGAIPFIAKKKKKKKKPIKIDANVKRKILPSLRLFFFLFFGVNSSFGIAGGSSA